jgi:chromosome segregation ATPase
MQQMKDVLLQQNEADLQRQIAQAGDETRAIELSMQQLPTGNDDELTAASPRLREAEHSRKELSHELEKYRAANQTLIEMCAEALSQTVYQRTGQKIKGVRATNNSSALTGFINTLGEESKIDQDISDIKADNYSIAVAGVVKNLDFKDLRPNWQDRD